LEDSATRDWDQASYGKNDVHSARRETIAYISAVWQGPRSTLAILPHLASTSQRSYYSIQITSIGWRSAIPGFSGYHAAKFRVEGLSEALHSKKTLRLSELRRLTGRFFFESEVDHSNGECGGEANGNVEESAHN